MVRIKREASPFCQAAPTWARLMCTRFFRVLDLWHMAHQGAIQCLQRQTLIHTAPQVPAADTTCEDIHEHSLLHTLFA
jgi:hypothetical protein